MMTVRRTIGPILAVLVCATAVHSQSAHPAFEVASVKPSPPPGAGRSPARVVRGGPGSTDPGSATFTNIDLFSLVTMAYGIKPYQIAGPDWLHAARFDITAKIPAGATRPQYRLMLQDLLAGRFKLALHHEQKELPTYDLVVGKNGAKFKAAVEDPTAVDQGLQPPLTITPPPGYKGPMNVRFAKCSMEKLADTLSASLGQPVTDATGLNGEYDITLRYTLAGLEADAAAANLNPTILDAVQEQLGLKLVAKKGPVDILVIDRVEKLPTDN
jgi:uncharacterized protein (TIGR03435 family)